MIVRILEDGQYEIDDDLDPLLKLDDELERAVKDLDEQAFDVALSALISKVRDRGRRLRPDELTASDLALPPEHSTIGELQALLGDST